MFGVAETESGGETVFREFYVEHDGEVDRLIALGSEQSDPKKHCSAKPPRKGSGEILASGSIVSSSRVASRLLGCPVVLIGSDTRRSATCSISRTSSSTAAAARRSR